MVKIGPIAIRNQQKCYKNVCSLLCGKFHGFPNNVLDGVQTDFQDGKGIRKALQEDLEIIIKSTQNNRMANYLISKITNQRCNLKIK